MQRKAGLTTVMLVLVLILGGCVVCRNSPDICIATSNGLRVSMDGGETYALSGGIEQGQVLGLLINDGVLFVGASSQKRSSSTIRNPIGCL